jgi:hypothetical protein
MLRPRYNQPHNPDSILVQSLKRNDETMKKIILSTGSVLAQALLDEYGASGVTERFNMISHHFAHPDRTLQIQGGHCQSVRNDIGWACHNDTDEGQRFCDECMDTIQSGDAADEIMVQYRTGQFDLLRDGAGQYVYPPVLVKR